MTGNSSTNHIPNHKSQHGKPQTSYRDLSSIPPIRTRRLVLSPVTESDAEDLQRAARRPEIADTMISIPHPYPEGEACRYIRRHLDEAQNGTSIAFAIRQQPECNDSEPTNKINASFIGMIEIRAIDIEHFLAELSFWVAVEAWGKGFMTEAVAAIVDFAFSSTSLPHLNRLYAFHMVRNPACGSVLKRNGFTREGILRDRVWKHDRFEDVAICAILRKDWESNLSSMPDD